MTRLYLDELVPAPHFPRPDGALPATSKVIMPDLQRTGIRSKYSKDWPTQPTDMMGRITDEFLTESASTLKAVPEPNLPLFYRELRANTHHKINLSKSLIAFEEERETRYQAMRRDLRGRVKSYGFSHIDSASMCQSPLALSMRSMSTASLAGQPLVIKAAGEAPSSSSGGNRPPPKVFSRITLFKSCLATAAPPKHFKKKRYGVIGRKTTLPIITPPLSTRGEDGDDDDGQYGASDSDPRRVNMQPVDESEEGVATDYADEDFEDEGKAYDTAAGAPADGVGIVPAVDEDGDQGYTFTEDETS